MATRMLELKGVSKAFGGLQVISDLDFHVDEHEIVSVIGPNGAGKTTLFNLITGVFEPDKGEILFEGESIGPAAATRSRAGRRPYVPDPAPVPEHDGQGERHGCGIRTHEGGLGRSVLRTPGMRREEREINKLAEEKLAFFGQRLDGYRQDQPAYSLSYANRPTARDRSRDGDERPAAAPRRAGRGNEPATRRTRSQS